MADLELFPFVDESGTGVDGRGIVIAAPDCHLSNITVHQGDDDGISMHNDFHGATLHNVSNIVDDWSRSYKGLLLGSNWKEYWPAYDASAGFAATMVQGTYYGVRAIGGIYNFIDCDIHIGQLAGVDIANALINFLRVRFWDIEKPEEWMSWWPAANNMTPVRVSGLNRTTGQQLSKSFKSELYFADCTWNGKQATGAELCRRFDPTKGGSGGAIPAACLRKEMITKCAA